MGTVAEPESFSDVLSRLPAGGSVALFVRHADRPELPPDPSGHAVSITEDGDARARALGVRLRGRIASVRTSPIVRCVETGRAIAGVEPVPDRMLGDPGPFVRDLDRAWEDFRVLGRDRVLARLASDVDAIDGLHPIRATAFALASHALAIAKASEGVHVFVTHDVVLLPLARVLLSREMPASMWPDFLEPLSLVREGDEVIVGYRELSVRVALEG